jgi:hypothetical protein
MIARLAVLFDPKTGHSCEAKKIISSGASCRHRSPEILLGTGGILGKPSCP